MTARKKAARKQAAQRMTGCIEIEEIVMGSESIDVSGYPGSEYALAGSVEVQSLLMLAGPGFLPAFTAWLIIGIPADLISCILHIF